MLDNSAVLHARRLAAKLHRKVDLDQLIDRDAGKINVQHVLAVGVPLQFANEGRFVDRAGQADQATAMPKRRRQRVGRHRQTDVRLAVPVQYRRSLARIAQSPVGMFAALFAGNGGNLVRHGNPRYISRPAPLPRLGRTTGETNHFPEFGENFKGGAKILDRTCNTTCEGCRSACQNWHDWHRFDAVFHLFGKVWHSLSDF